MNQPDPWPRVHALLDAHRDGVGGGGDAIAAEPNVGRMDGTSFIDLSDPSHPVYVGDLPKTEGARANTWRDIKVYANHAFVGSEEPAHGDDFGAIYEMAKLTGGGFTNLPPDKAALVDKLADRWGVEGSNGTCVWFEIDGR